ncbi:hypothetical protein ACFLVX_01920 [Chloroflexota bacterium]
MAKKRAPITDEHARGFYGEALDRLTGVERAVPAAPPRELPHHSGTMIKLSVFMPQEEDAYLERLASTAKFSGGKKLSKTRIIEAMVRAFRSSQLDVRGVKTEEELLGRLAEQLRK